MAASSEEGRPAKPATQPPMPVRPRLDFGTAPKPLQATVMSSSTAQEGNKTFTQYIILVKWPAEGGKSMAWTVARRFSEFDDLHKQLAQVTTDLPPLPSKTWWPSLSDALVQQRKGELDKLLQGLLTKNVVVHTRIFQNFLEIPQHVGEMPSENLPTSLGSIEDPLFGVNDFVYDLKEQVIFTACEDCHAFSRVDARLSNLRFPWEEKGTFTPVGSISCWLKRRGMWSLKGTEYFDSSASTVAWDPVRRYLFVGLDSGSIRVFLVDADFSRMAQMKDLSLHTARVTRLVYDAGRDELISAGRDKFIHVFDVKKSFDIAFSLDFDRAWISDMTLEREGQRLMVAAYDGSITIYDSTARPFKSLIVLTGHQGSVRCLHYSPRERCLFSGGFDNAVGIFNVGKPGETHRSRAVGWLRTGPPAKVKAVLFVPSENWAICAHDNGKIAVWNVMGGELLYVFNAHHSDILKLFFLEDDHVLISASHDGRLSFWLFPYIAVRRPDLPYQPVAAESALRDAAPAAAAAAPAPAPAPRPVASDMAQGDPQ